VTLLGSGAILTEVIKAAQLLAAQGMATDVFSVTSWSELARDGMACDQRPGWARPRPPFLRSSWGSQGPIIAATDYVRAVPESIRAWVPEGRRYVTLGTDGFGRSDTRAALRGSLASWMRPACHFGGLVALGNQPQNVQFTGGQVPARRGVLPRRLRQPIGICIGTRAGAKLVQTWRRRHKKHHQLGCFQQNMQLAHRPGALQQARQIELTEALLQLFCGQGPGLDRISHETPW
jgi:hypothetical protein